MIENKDLSITEEDLNSLYKYTMDKKTSIGFWLCQERYLPKEYWNEIKPVYKKYIDKIINKPLIDRHVACNLDVLLGSIDMMFPYINKGDDIYDFIDETYNNFLNHDHHNIKEKWNACIKNNAWHPDEWVKLRDETVNYLKENKNELYFYKDYFAVLNLIAKLSQNEAFDHTLKFNENRNIFLLNEYKFYENPAVAYLDLFDQFEEYVETKEENDRLGWYD